MKRESEIRDRPRPSRHFGAENSLGKFMQIGLLFSLQAQTKSTEEPRWTMRCDDSDGAIQLVWCPLPPFSDPGRAMIKWSIFRAIHNLRCGCWLEREKLLISFKQLFKFRGRVRRGAGRMEGKYHFPTAKINLKRQHQQTHLPFERNLKVLRSARLAGSIDGRRSWRVVGWQPGVTATSNFRQKKKLKSF